MESSSQIVDRHLPCPQCSSSDAYSTYDDGHGYCFSCQAYVPADPFADSVSPKPGPARKVAEFRTGNYEDLPDRKLFEKTLRKFQYTVTDREHYERYYDKNGNYVAQKVRQVSPKDFYAVGDMKAATLFGQQLWNPGGNRLVIFEGALDCMSYAQATGLTWECVSVPNGAPSAALYIRNEIQFVDSFDEVVFCFDMDTVGREAAKECAALLTPGKAKIARLSMKDASELLMAGKTAELKEAIYKSIEHRPDGIRRGSDLSLEEILKATPRGYSIPYATLNQAIRGVRKRELLMLCAGSGIGKSTMARELGVHLMREHSLNVGWVCLEESVQKTIQGIVAIEHNVPLMQLVENPHILGEADWRESLDTTILKGSFYDHFGSSEVEHLIGKIKYLAIGCQADFIILDHVSMVVSGIEGDERKAIDLLMTKLRQLAEQTGVGIIAVTHLKRNSAKGSYNEGASISLQDLRGSSSLEGISDCVIGLERNQQDTDSDASDITNIRLLKNRAFGVVGLVGAMKYDRHSGRLLPHTEEFEPSSPVLGDDYADIPF